MPGSVFSPNCQTKRGSIDSWAQQAEYHRRCYACCLTFCLDSMKLSWRSHQLTAIAPWLLKPAMFRDADNPANAEFAITVGDQWQRQGLARRLMKAIEQSACENGIEKLIGITLKEQSRDDHPGKQARLPLVSAPG